MCRLFAYLGTPVPLEPLLYEPEHSLIVQSYKPREMISGTVNADGFGIGWYHPHQDTQPFTYKNTLPIWNDINLPSLSRYIESGCVLSYIRSATPGQALDLSNCQPFTYQQLLFTHNGRIEQFRQTLYRPIRNLLSDEIYNLISGSTDSEHIFALLLNNWQNNPSKSLEQALHITLLQLQELAQSHQTDVYANVAISDGKSLIAARFTTRSPAPSLYWFQDISKSPNSIIIASEPLFPGNWTACPENSIISVGEESAIAIESI
jgi:glutamine amidotransferase